MITATQSTRTSPFALSALLALLVAGPACSGAPSSDPVGSTAAAVSGGSIASIALANVGAGACTRNSAGGSSFDSSCTGNGGSPEYWCADFARWVWQEAGADTVGLDAAAGSFYVYGQNNNTLGSVPNVGDAVVFDYHGGGSADHVAIVTQVNGDGTIETVSGDWGGSGGSEAAFSSTSHVTLNAPAYGAAVGSWPGIMGMTLSGFVAPVGLTAGPGSSGGPTGTPVPPTYYYRGVAGDRTGGGYWIVGSDGGIFSYGDAGFHGSMGGTKLNANVVGIARTPDGNGYWLAAEDGGVFALGDAPFFGSAGAIKLNQPVVGMAAMPDGSGYWLVAADGGVFSYGQAGFHGSMGGKPLNAPVVGMAASQDGGGYWLVAADGGIFAFGDAGFHGSAGAEKLNAKVVGMSASPSGQGYWLVAADGGIFSYGDAAFHGSMGGKTLNAPIVGMSATPDGAGYWLVAGDGGIFTFGSAPFAGSRG
jgi:hypothetical protein